jgi:hypothetical protein
MADIFAAQGVTGVKGLKIGIIVVGFVVAALFFWRFVSGKEASPDAPEETKTLWKCSNRTCGHEYAMTAPQAEEARTKDAKEGEAWPPAVCPKCGQRTVYTCQKCEVCGTVFFGPEVPGSTGACPKCYPEVKPPPPDEPVEEGQEAPRPRPKML